jgi:predicted chitinase
MQPIAEYGHGRGHPYGVPDVSGKAPYGRGFVQLTFRVNYIKADRLLGLGGTLAANYDLALDPAIAAKIAVRGMRDGWFTGRKLDDYITPAKPDYVSARKIINGTDRAELIAGYAVHFEIALTKAGA